MADLQVTCINKINRYDPHEGITHLGGYNWWMTRREVINHIKSSRHTFYTMSNGKRANLIVRRGVFGEYVQTAADGHCTNNLLELNECVVA